MKPIFSVDLFSLIQHLKLFYCHHGLSLILSTCVFLNLTEKAGDQGWEKEKAGPKVHSGLHPSRGGWHHGCC